MNTSTDEDETDVQYAERLADELVSDAYEFGADVETALVVAVREMRELRDSADELARLKALHGKWLADRDDLLNRAAQGYTKDAALEVLNTVLEDLARAMRGRGVAG
jgi:hypothetical protein